jgi:hypothetical protein
MKPTKLTSFISVLLFLSNFLFAQENISLAKNDNNNLEKIITNELNDDTVENNEVTKTLKIENKALPSIYSNGINYNLTKDGFVSLKIFDSNKNEVVSLVNRDQEVGNHFAHFSAINLTSGIYTYKVMVDNASIFTKILIVN